VAETCKGTEQTYGYIKYRRAAPRFLWISFMRLFSLQEGNFLGVRQLDPVRFLSIDHTGVVLTLLGHLNATVIKVLFNPSHEAKLFGIAHFVSALIDQWTTLFTRPALISGTTYTCPGLRRLR